MTPSLPRMTPPADHSEALAHASPEAEASLEDMVIDPPPGTPAYRVRPSAKTLVERLRQIQMQGWS